MSEKSRTSRRAQYGIKGGKKRALLQAIAHAIEGETIKFIPAHLLIDKKSVLACLDGIRNLSREESGPPSDIYAATSILRFRCNAEEISWQEVVVVLAKGIQYPTLYRLLCKTRRSESTHINEDQISFDAFIDVIHLLAEAADCENKAPSRTTAFKRDQKTMPVWFAHEANIKHNKKLQRELKKISGRLSMHNWIVATDTGSLIPMKNQCEPWLTAVDGIDQDILNELLDVCRKHGIATIFAHADHSSGEMIFTIRVQRPLVMIDFCTLSTWVRIPLYYSFSHLHTKQHLEFAELKRWMSGVGRPTRQSRDVTVATVRQIINEFVSAGHSRSEAWEMARRQMSLSKSYVRSRMRSRPTTS